MTRFRAFQTGPTSRPPPYRERRPWTPNGPPGAWRAHPGRAVSGAGGPARSVSGRSRRRRRSRRRSGCRS
ncbi:hypothetical protein FHE66_03080 [Georgenia sp. 311]|uniref:Uncharacterized protein n=1 Tax=Georgenia wutianyii TaxID=2585135 RepID=A0ABX5VLW4_9MICO|nr:hypothetical protein FE251_08930 [Georgenia wutianyii]TNC19467.1 hypothetical protein FHE66_03080 [Georgenia sp. 311]